MRLNALGLALGATFAVALVGCGSSEPEASATPATPETATASRPPATTEASADPTSSTPDVAPKQDKKLGKSQIVVSLDNGKSFTLELDTANAPKSTAGIADLVKENFYDGTIVHRVEPGFCVQWGDPYSKKGLDDPRIGTGGSGKQLPFEAGKLPFVKGTLGVASKGAGTGGDGQIFVMLGPAPSLDGNYAAIGKVTKGLDVVEAMKIGDKIVSMKVGE